VPEEAITKHYATQQERATEQREKEWIPAIETALKTIDKLTEVVAYDVIVGGKTIQSSLDLEIELTPVEKDSIAKELADYVGTASDEKFIDANDVVDYTAFVKEKASLILNQKVKAKIAKDAAEKAVNDYIRDNVVNYTPTTRSVGSSQEETGDFAQGIWKNNRNRK